MIQIDMPMPKCCDECFALDEHGDYPFCLISQDQRGYTFNTRDRRMPTCPLKAQVPKVMTLDELSETTIVYIENRVYGTVEPALSNGSYNDGTVGLITLEEEAMFYMLETDYNIEWRCWTSRPDEKRRAETPWN